MTIQTKKYYNKLIPLINIVKKNIVIKRKLNRFFALHFLFFIILFSLGYFSLKHEIKKIKKNQMRKEFINSKLMGGLPAPIELCNIPFGEMIGLVLSTKSLNLKNVTAPYNATLIPSEDSFLIFFRYDIFDSSHSPLPFKTYIGVTKLDKNFEEISESFKKIKTPSDYTEDPRIIKIKDALYLSYNNIQPHSYHCRSINISKFNLDNLSVDYTTNLDIQLQHIEKNWTPFEFINSEEEPKLYFEYNISPRAILEIPNPQVNQVNHLIFPDSPSPPRIPWKESWGHPRGGAVAQKIGSEYLNFFHSMFKDAHGVIWYVMAAYTFDAKPPFHITGVSPYPILFKGIYDSPHLNTSDLRKRCIFPCGFVIENKDGKDIVHVACGENDSAIKIVTLDKDILLKSLVKCKQH